MRGIHGHVDSRYQGNIQNLPAEYCTEPYSWNTPCCHCFHVLLFCEPLTMERGQCGHLTSICLQSQMLQAALFLQPFHRLGFPWTAFGTSYQNKCYITASIIEVFFNHNHSFILHNVCLPTTENAKGPLWFGLSVLGYLRNTAVQHSRLKEENLFPP